MESKKRFFLQRPLLGLLIFTLVQCNTALKEDAIHRLTYRCCTPDYLDSLHLTREEWLIEDRPLRVIEYHQETHKPFRFIDYQYREGLLVSRVDSTQFSRDEIITSYDQKRLNERIFIRSWLTVVNEIQDTVPHTQWQWFYDTTITKYTYRNQELTQAVEMNQTDTINLINYRYDENNRLSERIEGLKKYKLNYNKYDSLIREEEWLLSNASSNVTDSEFSEMKWRPTRTIVRNFNHQNLLTSEEVFDESIGELLYREERWYDSKNKLVKIIRDEECLTIIYR